MYIYIYVHIYNGCRMGHIAENFQPDDGVAGVTKRSVKQ